MFRSLALVMVVLAPATVAQESQFEKRATAYTQRIVVSQLDSTLPARNFAEWFKQTVSTQARISWEMNDCGEQTGTKADKERDIPICVEAVAELSGDRKVYIAVFVGTVRKGIWGRPGVFFGFIQDKNVTRDIKKLSDLPEMLTSQAK